MSWPRRDINRQALPLPSTVWDAINLAEERAEHTGIYGPDLWCAAFMVAARSMGEARPSIEVGKVGNVMPRVGGVSFRCDCGANVFHHPDGNPDLYVCNGCDSQYRGEG